MGAEYYEYGKIGKLPSRDINEVLQNGNSPFEQM
jgi:hypothetical protein